MNKRNYFSAFALLCSMSLFLFTSCKTTNDQTAAPAAPPEKPQIVKTELRSPKVATPVGPYSQGIKAGEYIFVSGQLVLDENGNALKCPIEEEATKVLESVKAVLEEGGSTMDDVVKTTILLRDIKDYPTVNKLYATYFKEPFPARATYQVASLPKGVGLEIECVAIAHEK